MYKAPLYLKEDGIHINRIHQEVEVGLRGARYGSDITYYLKNLEPPTSSGFIINPAAIAKVK